MWVENWAQTLGTSGEVLPEGEGNAHALHSLCGYHSSFPEDGSVLRKRYPFLIHKSFIG